MRRTVATAVAALMLMGMAQAQPPAPRQAPRAGPPAAPQVPTRVTASTLTTVCSQDRSACLTYVLGATDALAGALVAAGRPQVFCIPRGTTNDQVAQAAVRYLRAHPQEGGTNAALVILAGLQTSFPCGY